MTVFTIVINFSSCKNINSTLCIKIYIIEIRYSIYIKFIFCFGASNNSQRTTYFNHVICFWAKIIKSIEKYKFMS